MVEWLGEIIARLLFQLPGGTIRWLIFRRKTFKEYLTDDWDVNLFACTVFIVVLILICQFVP